MSIHVWCNKSNLINYFKNISMYAILMFYIANDKLDLYPKSFAFVVSKKL